MTPSNDPLQKKNNQLHQATSQAANTRRTASVAASTLADVGVQEAIEAWHFVSCQGRGEGDEGSENGNSIDIFCISTCISFIVGWRE